MNNRGKTYFGKKTRLAPFIAPRKTFINISPKPIINVNKAIYYKMFSRRFRAESEWSMNNEMMRQEINEAIEAGQRSLMSLKQAKDKLNSARGWGIVDIFGGGFFTDMMKHSKINDASRYLEQAKRDLLRFQRELKDVNLPLDLKMEIGGFLSFADFFFDGIVADYLVQSKIANAREQVDDAIMMVENTLASLKRM